MFHVQPKLVDFDKIVTELKATTRTGDQLPEIIANNREMFLKEYRTISFGAGRQTGKTLWAMGEQAKDPKGTIVVHRTAISRDRHIEISLDEASNLFSTEEEIEIYETSVKRNNLCVSQLSKLVNDKLIYQFIRNWYPGSIRTMIFDEVTYTQNAYFFKQIYSNAFSCVLDRNPLFVIIQ